MLPHLYYLSMLFIFYNAIYGNEGSLGITKSSKFRITAEYTIDRLVMLE